MPATDLQPLTLDPDISPWDRQPHETVLRHNQFCGYRDAGRIRSLRKVSETLGLNERYLRSVRAAYRWEERAEAWDLHKDHMDELVWAEARRRAADNDAALLNAAVAKVAGRLRTLLAEELEPADLIRLLDVTLKHRRALFGDPSITVAVTGPGGDPLSVQLADFALMSAEARRNTIAEMAAAVTRRAQAAAGGSDDDE